MVTRVHKHTQGEYGHMLEAQAASGKVGEKIYISEYIEGSGVGGKYEIVAADPGFNLINPAKIDGNYLKLVTPAEINVCLAGAVLDGVVDDTAAFLECIQYAWDNGIDIQLAGNSTFTNSALPVIIPDGGILKMTSIDVGAAVSAINIQGGDKSAIVGDGGVTPVAVKGTTLRFLTIKNVTIQGFDKFAEVSTNNLDSARWRFENVTADDMNMLLDSTSYALSRSTSVTFSDCNFLVGCVQLGDFYVDALTFDNCWFQHPSSGMYYIKCNANTQFNGGVRIPAGAGAAGTAFCLFTNDDGDGGVTSSEFTRNLSFTSMRNSNEGGNSPLVIADYPPVSSQGSGTPTISFDDCFLNGFHPVHYEASGTETGIIHFLQYPAGVSFKACSFVGLGSDTSLLASKDATLAVDADDTFSIEMDAVSYKIGKQVSSAIDTHNLAIDMVQFINNPDPSTFRDVIDGGHFIVVDSSTAGLKKLTFKAITGWNDPNYAAPISFLLNLSGSGTDANNDLNYAGSSVYLITLNGFFSGSHQARLASTKLHGDAYGLNDTANADIVSLHFGTADTGAATAARASEYDVTITFGANVKFGQASYDPYWIKGRVQRNLS